jgi:CRP/FNR family transcriptional regulator, cyclic AMP receptor protein
MFDIIRELIEEPQFKLNVKFTTRHFKAGEKILVQGVLNRSFYLIKTGTVRVIVSNPTPGEVTLRPGIADIGPDDIFGEFELLDDLATNADVSSLGDTELLQIDISSFKSYIDTKPEIACKIYQELAKTLVKRLRHADNVIYKLYAWGIKAHHLDEHLK